MADSPRASTLLTLLEVPVVGAPMAGGPSTPDLAAAVSDAGGLGFLAGGYLGVDQLARQVADVWDATDRPFGVNLFVPESANARPGRQGLEGPERAAAVSAYRERLLPEAERLGVDLPVPHAGDTDDWDRKVDLLVRERVPVVSFTFGLPDAAVLGALRRSGSLTVATVTDTGEARAALDAGVDGLVVQGHEGGGHRGTLDPESVPDEADLLDVVSEVAALADVPVVAAGGIADADRVAALLAAGAAAVQVGTALLLTPEAGTGLAYRRALADPSFTTTRVTRAFSGRLARSLETDFVREHSDAAPAAYPEVHHVTVPLRRASAAADRPDHLALWAGTGWRSARPAPAATVVAGLLPR
jgi:nitronate monooxygenase